MVKKFYFSLILLYLFSFPLYALKTNLSLGMYCGFFPSMGGSLNSHVQEEYFNSNNGINGMNRRMTGYNTSDLKRLLGAFGGLGIKTIFDDYYLLRIAVNYCTSFYGGEGSTIFTTDHLNYYLLKCQYSMVEYDIPLTVGISVPFWKDIKISLSYGIAFAYANYENSFKSNTYTDPFERKGSFKGWTLPMVMLLEGDYFITEKFAIITSLSYYWGSTKILKDSKKSDTTGFDLDVDNEGEGIEDFARIDFTGFRFSFGFSYYFYSI